MPSTTRDLVLLATCTSMPEGEEGWFEGTPLLDALAEVGLEGRWVAWDDTSVDWAGSLVAVRATWDYETRREQFLAWAGRLPRMLNSAAIFAWNTDKHYLPQLAAAGVPVVPTTVVEPGDDAQRELEGAFAHHAPAVV